WTPAVLAIRLRRPRRPLGQVFRQPGAAACAAGTFMVAVGGLLLIAVGVRLSLVPPVVGRPQPGWFGTWWLMPAYFGAVVSGAAARGPPVQLGRGVTGRGPAGTAAVGLVRGRGRGRLVAGGPGGGGRAIGGGGRALASSLRRVRRPEAIDLAVAAAFAATVVG